MHLLRQEIAQIKLRARRQILVARLDPDTLRTLLSIKEKEKLLALLTDESTTLKKRMDELVQMRLDGDMPKEAFPVHYKPLQERYSQIEAQLPELQAEVDFLKIQYLSGDTVLRDAKDLYDRWLSLPFEEKRTIVETITDKITVGKEDIAFSLSYLPTASLNSGNKQHNFKDS